jgi:hypothetical protein
MIVFILLFTMCTPEDGCTRMQYSETFETAQSCERFRKSLPKALPTGFYVKQSACASKRENQTLS